MLNAVLHSFFFWMPAVVALAVSFDMKSPVARAILFWGGLVFSVVIGFAVLGILMCDGRSLSVFANCVGGSGVSSLFAGAHPVFVTATYIYVLTGPALALVAWLIEWRHTRRARAA